MENNNIPYIETKEGEYYIRIFSQDVDEIELKWHRDDEDRYVQPIEKTDWMFQFDDELPFTIDSMIFIPRHVWHRVIKGSGNLKIKIKKVK